MRKSTRLQVVLAAIVVIVAGAVSVWAGDEEIRLKVEKNDSDQITIDINGTTEVITLDDLAEGEERTFDAGEHTVTVKRVGEELGVTLDDGELAGLLEGVEGTGKAKRVVVITDGDEAHAKAIGSDGSRHVIIHRGDGEIEVESEIMENLGDLEEIGEHDVWVHRLGEGEGRTMVFISGDDEEVDGERLELLLNGEGEDFHWVGSPCCHGDYVTYECPEDGTRLQVKKDRDTGGAHVCPVCGATLEVQEGPEILRQKVVVEVVEAAGEDGDDD
jgi:hypothetical protein